ncbi:MAG: response regulator [Eubacteriaceae bacterium]
MLNTVIVDDEVIVGEYLEDICKEHSNVKILGNFQSSTTALNFIKKNEVDIVFLDIEMPEMDGIALGEAINALEKNVVIIYTTGYDQYAIKAYENGAIAYLLKPYEEEDVLNAIDKASVLVYANKPKIEIRTFGYFAVFYEGRPITFSNAKSKELFALLVDRRGGEVTMEQALETMWPDREADGNVKSLYRRAVADLKNLLSEYTNMEIILGMRGATCLIPDEIDCDYFRFMAGERAAINQYNGYYLMDYPWSEITNSSLKRLAGI